MVVQRCPRYELLFQELKKNIKSEEEPSEDALLAQTAVKQIQMVNRAINEKKRIAENLKRVWEIQRMFPVMEENLVEPHRIFIKEDTFERIERNNRRAARLFLFNDIIVLGFLPLDLPKSSKPYFFNYRILPLPTTRLDPNPRSDNIFNLIVQQEKAKHYNLRLTGTDNIRQRKEDWMDLLQQTITQAEDFRNLSPLTTEGVKSTNYFTPKGMLLLGAVAVIIAVTMGSYVGVATLGWHLMDELKGTTEGYLFQYGTLALLLIMITILYCWRVQKRKGF